MATKLWSVFVGEGKRARQILEAPEKDARKYLEDNFPRLHIEPGANIAPQVDAYLKSPTGDVEHFHGPEAGWKTPLDTEALAGFGRDESDADLQAEFLAFKTQKRQELAAKEAQDKRDMEAWRAANPDHDSVTTEQGGVE